MQIDENVENEMPSISLNMLKNQVQPQFQH
jgi:hypothetical protein